MRTFQTGWPKTFYSKTSREMKTELPIGDTPVVDQDAIYARVIGLFISNMSLDFSVILARELSAYPPLMLYPTGQSTLKKSLQVEIPTPGYQRQPSSKMSQSLMAQLCFGS